jgi:hypothetical protein
MRFDCGMERVSMEGCPNRSRGRLGSIESTGEAVRIRRFCHWLGCHWLGCHWLGVGMEAGAPQAVVWRVREGSACLYSASSASRWTSRRGRIGSGIAVGEMGSGAVDSRAPCRGASRGVWWSGGSLRPLCGLRPPPANRSHASGMPALRDPAGAGRFLSSAPYYPKNVNRDALRGWVCGF